MRVKRQTSEAGRAAMLVGGVLLHLVAMGGGPAQGAPADLPAAPAAEKPELADLDLNDVTPGEALRILADRYDVSIVAGPLPTTRITLRLRNVDVDDALWSVATVAGLRLERHGGIVRIAPLPGVPVPDSAPRPAASGDEAELLASRRFDLGFDEDEAVPKSPYRRLILDRARRYDVSAALVTAMVRVESAFDPSAGANKGARGLMQVMPTTAVRFGVSADRLLKPAENLEAGMRYLKFLTKRYPGDLVRILAAYNAGEGSVDNYGGVPPYPETRDYVRRVSRHLGLI